MSTPPTTGFPQVNRDLLTQPDAVPASVPGAMKKFIDTMIPHVRSLTLAPNIHGEPLPAAAASPATELRGYVAKIEGSAVAGKILDRNLAQTTLAFPVVGDSSSTEPANDLFQVNVGKVEKDFKPVPMFDDYRGISVGLYSTHDGPDTQYVVVAQGNDSKAVQQFLAKYQSKTLDTIFQQPNTKDYSEVVDQSRTKVANAAKYWAQQQGLRVGEDPIVETRSFTLKHDRLGSTVDPAETKGGGGKPAEIYVYHNDVVDAATAKNGSLLRLSPLQGFVELRAPQHTTAEGRKTHAWTNDKHNLVPLHTGPHVSKTGRRAALHVDDTERSKAATERRIKWDGPIRNFNPLIEAKVNDADAQTLDWIRQCATGTNLIQRPYSTIIYQPAGLDPSGLSLSDLMAVSRGLPTVTLPVSEPLLGTIVRDWPLIYPKVAGYGPTDLRRVFEKQSADGAKIDVDRKILDAMKV